MHVVFVFALGIVLVYTIFKTRRFDFFSIAALSAFIYYYPGVIGYISTSLYDKIPIDASTYSCLCIFLAVLLVFMIIADKYAITIGTFVWYNPYKNRENYLASDYSTNLAVLIVELLGLLMLAKTFSTFDGFRVNFNKMQLLANSNRFTEYLKYISLFTFVYSYVNTGWYNKTSRIISSILIGYTFVLGHRSFMVIGIIAIFMHYVNSTKKVRLVKVIRKHWVICSGMFLAALFFLFVKNIFAAFMAGQYELVMSRLTNPEYYVNSLLNSEANSITSNLHKVVSSGMEYSFGFYLLGLLQLIPLVGGSVTASLGYVSFEKKLNLAFNTQLDQGIGLASTYLGEAYSMGGSFMVMMIMFFTFCALLFLVYRYNNTNSSIAYTYYGIIATYFTFYLHRNSLVFLLIMARAYLYIWILIWLIRVIIRSMLRKSTKEMSVKNV